jgi:hypothetical protein
MDIVYTTKSKRQLNTYMKSFKDYLKEEIQVSKGTDKGTPEKTTGSAMFYSAPPSQKPAYRKPAAQPGYGAPTDPGEPPKRQPGETEEQYARRYKKYLELKKIWDTYRQLNFPFGNVFTYPARIPGKRVKHSDGTVTIFAQPPAQVGDIYIDDNGQVWQVQQDQFGSVTWERVN